MNSAQKESYLTPMPLYLLDADETEVFDFGGTTKNIDLNGIYIGDDVAACKTFIDAIEGVIQGKQDTQNGYPLTFTDDYRGTIYVKVLYVNSNNEGGEPLIIRWNIKLIQSSQNA